MTSRSASRGPSTRALGAAAGRTARWSMSAAAERADEPAGDRAGRAEQRAAGRGAGDGENECRPSVGHSRETGTHRPAAAATTARSRLRRPPRRRARAPSARAPVTIAACLAGKRVAPAKQQHVARREICARSISTQMRARRLGERLRAASPPPSPAHRRGTPPARRHSSARHTPRTRPRQSQPTPLSEA